MDEKTICADIQELAEQLNGKLKAAQELGLKVSVQAQDLSTFYFGMPSMPQVRIRVWREQELLKIPNYGSAGTSSK